VNKKLGGLLTNLGGRLTIFQNIFLICIDNTFCVRTILFVSAYSFFYDYLVGADFFTDIKNTK